MRRPLIVVLVFALAAAGAYALTRPKLCATSSQTAKSDGGGVTGNFDTTMSGVCQFACATKLKYKDADVVAQPGAVPGRLTQCPVSGVVFVVEKSRPTTDISGTQYVACCGNCAAKLQAEPAHYLRL